MEAIKIGESEAAPLLTQIVGPSEEGKEAGKKKKEIAERYTIRRRFWTDLLERAKQKTKLHSSISPGEYSWVGTGSGLRGLGYNYSVTKHSATVELYIDRGKDCQEENKQIFEQLVANKQQIEEVFRDQLEWQRLETKRACRIKKVFALGGYRDEESKWLTIHEAMIDAMMRLEKALRPHIQKIKI